MLIDRGRQSERQIDKGRQNITSLVQALVIPVTLFHRNNNNDTGKNIVSSPTRTMRLATPALLF